MLVFLEVIQDLYAARARRGLHSDKGQSAPSSMRNSALFGLSRLMDINAVELSHMMSDSIDSNLPESASLRWRLSW
ncbi:hypothetical protein SCP_0102240 [Sparassis crispa]|uniref:Uncharacterized protein n=1 Tax=Sparassis crispa TaxID=139825 RepID=A0A401G5B2_9APHY|nr:hypothetical protein SCP_0102240 [Sparassis crispa]GBE77351.1 hypothetical protein SCP_0102240 [Sparassis crispa]